MLKGLLKSDATVHNLTKDSPERLGHLVMMQGKTQTHVPEVKAGDLGAVAKLKETQTNDSIGDGPGLHPGSGASLPPSDPFVRHRAEDPRRRRKDQPGIASAADEDPSIRYTRDPQTKECSYRGRGSSTSR